MQDIYGTSDRSSFSRPLHTISTHINLVWDINFDQRIIEGTCEHLVKILEAGVTEVYFDSSNLNIIGEVLVNGKVTYMCSLIT